MRRKEKQKTKKELSGKEKKAEMVAWCLEWGMGERRGLEGREKKIKVVAKE